MICSAQESGDRAESGTPRVAAADRSTAGAMASVKAATFRGPRAGLMPARSPVPNMELSNKEPK
jgi:hypothetical protein